VVLEAEEVAGTSLPDRLLQHVQEATLGQRSELALWALRVLHGVCRKLARTARGTMFQVCPARPLRDDDR